MFSQKKLEGDITVIDIEPVPYLSGVGIWIPRGSLIEDLNELGWVHLSEHLSFRRVINGSNDLFLNKIEKLGMIYSAHTSQEYVSFFARFPSSKFDICLKMLLEIAVSPLDASLDVIKKEIAVRDIEDRMSYSGINLAQNLSIKQLLGQDCTSPLGTQNIDQANLSDFYNFHQKNFHAEGAVVVFTHNDPDYAFDQVNALLPEYNSKHTSSSRTALVPIRNDNTKPKTYESKVTKEYVSVSCFFPGRTEQDHDLANLFCRLLGVGLASRLYQRVVVADAQAYTVELRHMVFEKVGVLALASSSAKRTSGFADYFADVIWDEFEKIRLFGFAEEEVKGAGEHYLSYTHALAENKTKFMMTVAERAFAGKKVLDPRVAALDLMNLPASVFQDFADKYLTQKHFATTVLVPQKVR